MDMDYDLKHPEPNILPAMLYIVWLQTLTMNTNKNTKTEYMRGNEGNYSCIPS